MKAARRAPLSLFWVIGPLLVGSACASSTAGNEIPTAMESRPVESGGRDVAVDPDVGDNALLTGRVTNLEGLPLSKVTVRTTPPTATAITGDEGTFSLGLPMGTYTLTIVDASGEIVEQVVEVNGSTELGDVQIDAIGDAMANPTAGGDGRPVESGGRDSD